MPTVSPPDHIGDTLADTSQDASGRPPSYATEPSKISIASGGYASRSATASPPIRQSASA